MSNCKTYYNNIINIKTLIILYILAITYVPIHIIFIKRVLLRVLRYKLLKTFILFTGRSILEFRFIVWNPSQIGLIEKIQRKFSMIEV